MSGWSYIVSRYQPHAVARAVLSGSGGTPEPLMQHAMRLDARNTDRRFGSGAEAGATGTIGCALSDASGSAGRAAGPGLRIRPGVCLVSTESRERGVGIWHHQPD